MKKIKRQPTHPGEIIKEDYLEPLKMTIKDMALVLKVSRKTLSKIVNQRGAVTPEMALRLARAFKTTPDLWLNLQKNYDLWFVQNKLSDWKLVKPLPKKLLCAEV